MTDELTPLVEDTRQPDPTPLVEALREAAKTFREYERLHAAKLGDSTPSGDYVSITRKVERNRQLAEQMEIALTTWEKANGPC